MQYQIGTDGIAAHLSIGRVLKVHTNAFTATVEIFAGNNAGSAPPCRYGTPACNPLSKTGVIFVPEEDDLVYVDWSYGSPPFISHYYVLPTSEEKPKAYKTQVSPVRGFGGEDPVHQTGAVSYRWGPTDVMPGDKLIMGKLGNFLGVLAGGISLLSGGQLSQIMLSKYDDLVRIVSRKFELISDFGVMKFANDKGANTFELYGNDADTKSNDHKEAGWDYTFKLGGVNLFEFKLLKNLFKFIVDRDGRIQLNATSARVVLQEPPVIVMKGDSVQKVEGHRSNTIEGDDYKEVSGSKITKTSRSVFICAGASNEVVSGAHAGQFMSVHKTVVRGPGLLGLFPEAKETTIAAGTYKVSIGNPLNLGIPPPLLAAQAKMGDYELEVFSGDINLGVTVKGSVNVSTLLGDITGATIAGNVDLSSALGNVDISTLAGDVDVSTLLGNIGMTTLAGNGEFSTAVGNIDIKALAGKITLTAGLTSIEMGPAGIKIKNGPTEELFTLLNEILTAITSATTPGYGAPLGNVAQFIALIPRLTVLKGV